MLVKAPAPAPTVYNWTGFYLGINGGYGLGRDPFDQTNPTPGFPTTISSISSRVTPQGGLFGGQLGYNLQSGHMVYGLEGDLQRANQNDTAGCGLDCISNPLGPLTGIAGSAQQQITWFGTARGRLGWANDGWLFYITGGGAWGGIKATTAASFAPPPIAASETTNLIKSGWAFGGGTEVRIAGPWTAKIEYLYLDLGSTADTLVLPPPVLGPGTLTTNSSIHDHIVRAGLNYRLDEATARAGSEVAPPRVVYSWTGFHVGINGGYGLANDPFSQTQTNSAPLLSYTSSINSRVTPQGGLLGGQFGYDLQSGHMVYGLEGDLQWASQKDTAGCGLACMTILGASGGTDLNGSAQQTITWFGTARGRLGWANDGWLLYITGGGVWGGINAKTADAASTTFSPIFTPFAASQTTNFTKSGWVFGGGTEVRVAGPWTAKIEYLYMDLGSVADTLTVPAAQGALFGTTLTTSSSIHDHVVRVGLNYNFN